MYPVPLNFIFPFSAIVLCIPVGSELSTRVLMELDIIQKSHTLISAVIMIQPESPDLFLPTSETSFSNNFESNNLSSNFSIPNISHYQENFESRTASVDSKSTKGFTLFHNLSEKVRENLLVMVPFDQR